MIRTSLPKTSAFTRHLRRQLCSSRSLAADHVRIVEVAPRDGLQNEKSIISLDTKIELVERLAKTGITHMEAGSFVAAKWVPQMASTSEVCRSIISRPPNAPHPIAYNYLVPNVRGIETLVSVIDQHQSPSQSGDGDQVPITSSEHPDQRALEGTVLNSFRNSTEISLFAAATETFSNKNTNCSIQASLDRCKPILEIAKNRGIRARGYVSVALGCPYEGPDVDPHRVAEMTTTLLEMGCDEVSVADTTGMGTAPRTQRLLKTLREAGIQDEDIALHFHDTYGQALVNTVVGLEHGIRTFDCSVGGLGGCPFSKGATGNVSTEDLLHLLHSVGVQTGVNLEEMAEIGAWISGEMGRRNESRAGKAILARKRA